MNRLRIGLLGGALLLSGVSEAQTPSPAQLGLVVATPNVVQVLDSSKNWATIGTIDPTTHTFTVVGGGGGGVSSFNTRTGAVTLTTGDVTGALGFTPYNATNPSGYQTAAQVTSSLTPYALLASPAFTGTPSLPTGTTGVTQSPGDSTTKLATTAFVSAATSGGGTITANSTPTSGFTAGQVPVSDGAKVQASAVGVITSWGDSSPIYMTGISGGNYPNMSFSSSFTGSGINPNPLYGVALFVGGPGNPRGVSVSSGGFIGFNTSDNYTFELPDTAFFADSTYVISQHHAANAQALRSYNTFTDINNGEWGALDWQTVANTLTIGAEKNGTGTLRPVNIVGSIININGAAPNTNGGLATATTSSVAAGSIETGGGSGVAPVGLAAVAAGSYLKSNGVTTIPAWQAFGTNVQAALAVNAGSTGSVALQSGAITTGDLVKWNGAAGVSDATAVPTTNGFISNGTKPTNTTGTCPGSSGAGGATAGTFVLVNICAAAGTVILTALPTAATGWSCDMEDRVTRTAIIVQSAATTTSATFIMGATPSVANDVFQWKCAGY